MELPKYTFVNKDAGLIEDCETANQRLAFEQAVSGC